MSDYRWKVGDVFANGPYRWKVDSISGDRAVLRSCSSSWATTMLLTFDEWNDSGRWKLETDGNQVTTQSSGVNRGSAAQDSSSQSISSLSDMAGTEKGT